MPERSSTDFGLSEKQERFLEFLARIYPENCKAFTRAKGLACLPFIFPDELVSLGIVMRPAIAIMGLVGRVVENGCDYVVDDLIKKDIQSVGNGRIPYFVSHMGRYAGNPTMTCRFSFPEQSLVRIRSWMKEFNEFSTREQIATTLTYIPIEVQTKVHLSEAFNSLVLIHPNQTAREVFNRISRIRGRLQESVYPKIRAMESNGWFDSGLVLVKMRYAVYMAETCIIQKIAGMNSKKNKEKFHKYVRALEDCGRIAERVDSRETQEIVLASVDILNSQMGGPGLSPEVGVKGLPSDLKTILTKSWEFSLAKVVKSRFPSGYPEYYFVSYPYASEKATEVSKLEALADGIGSILRLKGKGPVVFKDINQGDSEDPWTVIRAAIGQCVGIIALLPPARALEYTYLDETTGKMEVGRKTHDNVLEEIKYAKAIGTRRVIALPDSHESDSLDPWLRKNVTYLPVNYDRFPHAYGRIYDAI